MERTVYMLCCLLMVAGTTYAQQQNCNITWGEPIMISSSEGDSYSPKIALSGDSIVHITWQFDGEVKLPYRRSTDGGNTFELEQELIHDTVAYPYYAYRPLILANRNTVYLFFIAGTSRVGDEPIRMLKSHDGGTTWDNIATITSNLTSGPDYGTNSGGISGLALGDTLLLLYKDVNSHQGQVIVSTNAGLNWNRKYDNVVYDSKFAFTPGVLHTIMRAVPEGSSAGEVMYARSTDLGDTWCDSTLLSSNDGYFSENTAIAGTGYHNISEVWTAWRDEKYGYYGVGGASIISRTNLEHSGWQPEQILTDQPKGVYPSLATNGRNHAIAWWHEEVGGESTQVVVRATQTSLNSFCPMENITPHKYTGWVPEVVVSSHAIHVVWEQLDSDGKFHTYYRKGEFGTTNAQLTMADSSVSFDPTVISTFRNAWVTLSNTGSDDLDIGTILPNDSNVAVTPTSLSIAAGDNAEIKVSFIPKSSGTKEGKIVLYHNGASSPDVIPVNGEGIEWNAVIGSWNLISTPFNLDAGFSLPLLYAWDSMYVQSDSMVVGRGYWAKLSSPLLYTGTAVLDNTVTLNTGWNVVGSVSVPIPAQTIISDPGSNLASQFFGYTNGKYMPADTLKPGFGYWVKAKQGGRILLQGSSPRKLSKK